VRLPSVQARNSRAGRIIGPGFADVSERELSELGLAFFEAEMAFV
jgi:hypothetical protein